MAETLEYWEKKMDDEWTEIKKALAEMRHNPVDLLNSAEDKLTIVGHCILFSDMAEINTNAFAVLPESIAEDVIQANEVVLKMVDYFFFKKNVEGAARQLPRQRTIS